MVDQMVHTARLCSAEHKGAGVLRRQDEEQNNARCSIHTTASVDWMLTPILFG
jgi:hypothetical protein